MTTKISMIAAMDQNRVIGYNGGLPWNIKKDLKWFYQNTKDKIVVMGRKNYLDIIRYTNGKPLPNRTNVILSSTLKEVKDFIVVSSIEELLKKFPDQELVIIGGETLYEQFLPYSSELILTEINAEFLGDTFFPKFDKKEFKEVFREKDNENNLFFHYVIYQK